MRKKELTLKNMIETLVNASWTNDDILRISNMFYEMYSAGFIGVCTWRKFSRITDGWHYDADYNNILDGNETVVWNFESDGEYHYGE